MEEGGTWEEWEATRECDRIVVCIFFFIFFQDDDFGFIFLSILFSISKLYSLLIKVSIIQVNACFFLLGIVFNTSKELCTKTQHLYLYATALIFGGILFTYSYFK